MNIRDRLAAGNDPVAGSRILTERLPVQVSCAWCSHIITAGSPDKVSHGICERCLAAVMAA